MFRFRTRRPLFIRAFAWRLALRLRCPRRVAGGYQVFFFTTDEGLDELAARLDRALTLLGHSDARRDRALRSYARQFIVWAAEYSLAFPRSGQIVLSASMLETGSVPWIASMVVHEATHLRIYHRGIPYTRALKGRIERRCVAEQAAFLRLCGREAEAAYVEDALKEQWWTDEHVKLSSDRFAKEAQLTRWHLWLGRAFRWLT